MIEKQKKYGFSLIEVLLVIAIVSILAIFVVPNFLDSQRKGRLKGTVAEVESSIKVARNRALTGFESNNALPSGGYGVFFSTDTLDPNLNRTKRIAFLDGTGAQAYFIDAGEYATTDIAPYLANVTLLSIKSYPDCVNLWKDAAVVFQPPRADVVIMGHTVAAQGNLVPVPGRLFLTFTVQNSALPEFQKKIEVTQATGRIQVDPTGSC